MASDMHYIEQGLSRPINGSVLSKDKSSDTETKKSSLLTTLLKLLKKKKHREKLERIIKESGPRILTDCDTTLLLRLAKNYQNYTLFALIFDSKFQPDVQLPDLTSLLSAIMNEEFTTASRLYRAHTYAIISQLYGNRKRGRRDKEPNHDGEEIQWREKSWAKGVMAQRIAVELSERGLDAERMGLIFQGLLCNLSTIVDLKNPELTKAFLQRDRPRFHSTMQLESIFQTLFKTTDARHLEVFLLHNRNLRDQLTMAEALLNTLLNNMRHLHESEAGRALVKALPKHEFYDGQSLEFLERALAKASRENLEIFLEYEEFRAVMMSRCGRDILAASFGNSDSIPSLLKLKRKVDVDARGSRAYTPLHFAARSRATESARYLLHRGADPNALDELGSTPLGLALRYRVSIWTNGETNDECVEALLAGGADPLKTYEKTGSWYFLRNAHEFGDTAKRVAARIAIDEALGMSVEEALESFARLVNEDCRRYYEQCRRQLLNFKGQKLRDDDDVGERGLSMFEVISGKEDQLARRIDDEDRCVIETFVKECESEECSYYCDVLKRRLEIVDRMRNFIDTTKWVLLECMRISDLNHLVICKILNYLDRKDLLTG